MTQTGVIAPHDEAGIDLVVWLQSTPAPAGIDAPRWRVLEAMARRTAELPHGPLRSELVTRLQARWADLERSMASATSPQHQRLGAASSLLAELTSRLNGFATPTPGDHWPELRSAQLDRRTWTRLRVERRLAQMNPPPAQTVGPLNALALVPRALAVLNACSPEYLQRLLGYIEALGALDPPGGNTLPQEAGASEALPKRTKKR